MKNLSKKLLIVVCAYLPFPAFADPSSVVISPSFTTVNYIGSSIKETAETTGISLTFHFLEDGELTLGNKKTDVVLKPSNAFLPKSKYTQEENYISVGQNFTPDRWNGIFSIQNEWILSDGSPGAYAFSNTFRASYLNYDKTHYFDIGRTTTSYNKTIVPDPLTVYQITPTVGLLLTESDWIQIRKFDIRISNPAVSRGLTETNAFDVQYSHYLKPGHFLNKFQIGTVIGQRMFAVDGSNLYNFAHLQKAGSWVSFNSDNYMDNFIGNLQLGYDTFEDAISNYNSFYMYINLKTAF